VCETTEEFRRLESTKSFRPLSPAPDDRSGSGCETEFDSTSDEGEFSFLGFIDFKLRKFSFLNYFATLILFDSITLIAEFEKSAELEASIFSKVFCTCFDRLAAYTYLMLI